MWITFPLDTGHGTHKVLVPKGFDKTIDDFRSINEYLNAIRATHKQLHTAQH